MSRLAPRQEQVLALGLLAAGGLVALVADARSVAVVALAGAAALLLVGGRPRRLLGGLLLLAGAGLAASGGPVALVAGAVVAAGGAWAAARGHRWPSPRSGPVADPGQQGSGAEAGPRAAWDALDRGEDPTR